MAQRYLAGIDIGTSGSKGVIVDLDGRVLAYKFIEHATEAPRPGWYEHDAEAIWWSDLCRISRALVNDSGLDPRQIVALGVSGLAPEMLPLDEAGRPLRKAVLYSDSRAQKQIDELVARYGEDEIVRIAGRKLSTMSVGPKVLWFRENEPALFARTSQIHTCSSYLVFKLTGRSVTDCATANGFAPLFNSSTLTWDERICSDLDLPPSLFPKVCHRWGTDVAGEITRAAAEATGLAEGTAVTVGVSDATADLFSVGAAAPGDASLSYGTTMLFELLQEPLLDATGTPVHLGSIPAARIGGFPTSAAGALTTWFRNNFGQMERDAERTLGINAYSLLSQEAESIPPGSEGLLVLPYFAGERAPVWDTLARGLILGLTLSHTRRHIYRALLEGIAYGVRQGLEQLLATGAPVKRIIATGGGTKSRLWVQIISDVLGRDQDVVLHPIGAPYGDAFLAGYGVGLFYDLSPLQTSWAPATTPVVHNPDTKAVYERYYDVCCRLYGHNKEAMHALADLSASK